MGENLTHKKEKINRTGAGENLGTGGGGGLHFIWFRRDGGKFETQTRSFQQLDYTMLCCFYHIRNFLAAELPSLLISQSKKKTDIDVLTSPLNI